MIRLKKISAENLWDVVDLRVKKEQKNFVAANANSLLEAYLAAGSDCTAFPFAIYDDKKLDRQ